MELIKSLIFVLEILGLVFVIGLVVNLILDVVIIDPIMNRKMMIRKAKLFDLLIEKIQKGEDIPGITVDEIKEKIED